MTERSRSYLSKRFGQVFLTNKSIARKEVEALSLEEGERVLEIGPGPGIITEILLEQKVTVTAVEPDHVLYESLLEKFDRPIKEKKLILRKEDFLKMEPGSYDKIIGNIPYNISSKIMFRLFDFDFKRAVLMVQKEFANRLVAEVNTSDYSRLTVNTKLRFDPRILIKVPKGSFRPIPKVDSAVVLLEKREIEYGVPLNVVDDVLIKLFSKRRKKISSIFENCPQEIANKRPEELSIEEILALSKIIFRSSR